MSTPSVDGGVRSIVMNGCDADETHEMYERLQREAAELRKRWLGARKPARAAR